MSVLFNALAIVLSYLIGSFPTGYLLASIYGIKDIRLHGSGNIGATNVARLLGLRFFIPVFLFDAAKAYIPIKILMCMGYGEWFLVCAALVHLIGNGCSIFLNGQGGKGVASSIGLLAVLQPCVLPYVCGIWLLLFTFTRTVGIASIIAICMVPFFSLLCGYDVLLCVFSVCVSVWVFVRHKSNICVLMKRILE